MSGAPQAFPFFETIAQEITVEFDVLIVGAGIAGASLA
jgi:glycerol-3-phosphate dehydrogenase